ncbi:response regulator transcription factor [Nocardia sp. CA-128927]|uniref:response regulator transcription factor n=1 Tax=Nocardia sp. CA-128927 TaxID=3239975 RepID=UPI003D9926EC
MPITIIVAEKLLLSRSALVALLERNEEIRVVGSTSIGVEAVDLASHVLPDVVLISSEVAHADGIAVAEQIAGLLGCKSLLLGEKFARTVVRRAFAGPISGLVPKSALPHQLFEAIYQVHRGQRVFDADLTVAAIENRDCPLTLREISILEQVSLGDEVTEIAAKNFLSEGTVRNYLSSAVAKLGARNRIDALRVAREAQWI